MQRTSTGRSVHVCRNPHLQQVMCPALPLLQGQALPRVLAADAPRMPYRRRRGEVKSVVHWGQRKLLLSEIEFLTQHAEPGITCVYAGAAPGTHIEFLADLFPRVNFVLVDPAPFAIRSSERIRIWQEFMTDDVAREFVGERTLLISDIRSADWKVLTPAEMEAAVRRDMTWQLNWFQIMQPAAAMLKFRLPWDCESSVYLNGDIMLPIWGPQTTTEARLVVTSLELRTWDHRQYQEQMFYFNTITRVLAYDHGITAPGLDYCYDCAAEAMVLTNYLARFGKHSPSGAVSALVQKITEACGGKTHGRNLVNWRHGNTFASRTYDTDNLQIVEHARNGPVEASSGRERLIEAVRAGTKWSEIPEPALYEVEWGAGQRSSLGIGSAVPPDSGLDLWVWNLVAELSGSHSSSPLPRQQQLQQQTPTTDAATNDFHVLVSTEVLKHQLLHALCPNDAAAGQGEQHAVACVLLCATDAGAAFILFVDTFGSTAVSKLHLPCFDDEKFTCMNGNLVDDLSTNSKTLILANICARRGQEVTSLAPSIRRELLQEIHHKCLASVTEQPLVLQVLSGITKIEMSSV